MKIVKYIVVLSLIALITSACHNSYKYAKIKNQNYLIGDREDLSMVHLELNDQLLLLRNINTLAMDRVILKDNYLLAKDLEEQFNEMLIGLNVRAKLNRITLADELSEARNDQYYALFNQKQEDFDEAYQKTMDDYIVDLKSYLLINAAHPENEEIRDLSKVYLEEAVIADIAVTEVTTDYQDAE